MAIRLVDTYPNRTGAPDADYPHGIPRNRSAPGAVDGTPFEQAWFRDKEGFMQGLLETAGITPSGNPDTVDTSDYLDALNLIAHGVLEVDMGGSADVTLGIYPGRVAALRLTGVLGADVDLIVSNTERLYWIIDETTGGFSVTVRTSGGAGITLSESVTVARCDGTDVVSTLGSAASRDVGTDPGDVLPAGDALGGASQSWQDVSGSRALNVTYTNSTGRPISALVTVQISPDSTATLEMGGINRARFGRTAATTGVDTYSFFVIVPDGVTYEISSSGTVTALFWQELR